VEKQKDSCSDCWSWNSLPKYIDLHVLPRVEDERSCRKMAELLYLAGYSTVALTVPTGLMQERRLLLRRLFEEVGIETALRADLAPMSRHELLRLLRRFRSSFDVLGVKCVNEGAATVACRDRRVDLVFLDPRNSKIRFGHSLANLLRSALEFNLISAFLIESNRHVYDRLTKEAEVAREHGINIVLSSGSTSPAMIRSPFQMASIGSVIGLLKDQALRGVSEIPRSILSRNLERRKRGYVEEGVKVVLPRTENRT